MAWSCRLARLTWLFVWLSRRRQTGASDCSGSLTEVVDSSDEAKAEGRLKRCLKMLFHPALLVVHEIG